MLYRILRNNKEQGPLNLDELVALQLRPFDLIWEEGKSASWRYPAEVESLQQFLNPTLAHSNEIRKTNVTKQETTPVKAPLELDDSAPEEVEITADMLEQKANAIYLRIQAYNAQCEQQAKDVHTKYARSLEELKQDYADWLHKKKRKRSALTLDNKGWMALGAMCTAFIFFILAGKDNEAPLQSNKQVLVSESSMEAKQISNAENPIRSTNNNYEGRNNTVQQTSSVDAFIDSVRKVINKKETFYHSANADKVSKTKSARKADTQTLLIAPTLDDFTLIPEMPKPSADLNAYYTLTEKGDRIKEVHITVNNTGNVALKQIKVEVIYYKKKDQVLTTEMLNFSNLNPGNTTTLTKPGNKRAVAARFRLVQFAN